MTFLLASLFCLALVAFGTHYRRGEFAFPLCSYAPAFFPLWAPHLIDAPGGQAELSYPLYLIFYPLYSSIYMRGRRELLRFVWTGVACAIVVVSTFNLLLSGQDFRAFDVPSVVAFSVACTAFTVVMRWTELTRWWQLLALSIAATALDLGIYAIFDTVNPWSVYAANLASIAILMPIFFLPLLWVRR